MKLSAGIWILIGFCICFCCLVGGWVTYQPNMDEAHNRDLNREAADNEHAKEPQAKKRLAGAVKLVEAENATWKTVSMEKTPPSTLAGGGIDIGEDGAQLVVDSRHFRDSMQTAVNHQVRVGGVKLISNPGPRVADPGESPSTILAEFYNFPAIPFPVVIFDFGTITVEGTYEQITANVRAWAHMPNYLAVSDGLRLEGTSPHLQGTYALSIVGYIRGHKLFSPLPEVPGSANGGAGGGGRGGGPGAAGPATAPSAGGNKPGLKAPPLAKA
jgi:hypothetical protein